MATKDDLKHWTVEALQALGGSGSVLKVSKYVWEEHRKDLEQSGSLLYTWQYDLRWAAQQLRNEGVLKPVYGRRGGPWELADD